MSDLIYPSTWRKSRRSNGGNDMCVEAGRGPGVVAVRDTKDRSVGPLIFSKEAWATFANQVKAGRLDR